MSQVLRYTFPRHTWLRDSGAPRTSDRLLLIRLLGPSECLSTVRIAPEPSPSRIVLKQCLLHSAMKFRCVRTKSPKSLSRADHRLTSRDILMSIRPSSISSSLDGTTMHPPACTHSLPVLQ